MGLPSCRVPLPSSLCCSHHEERSSKLRQQASANPTNCSSTGSMISLPSRSEASLGPECFDDGDTDFVVNTESL